MVFFFCNVLLFVVVNATAIPIGWWTQQESTATDVHMQPPPLPFVNSGDDRNDEMNAFFDCK